jgi:type I restriction enzyme, S subunit
MMMYQTDPAKLRSDYLVCAIYSDAVQNRMLELAGGSTVGHIRVNDIRTLPIPHPVCVKEQERIAATVASSTNAIKVLQESRRKLSLIKSGLMQDLLTGRIRVIALLEPESQREKVYA